MAGKPLLTHVYEAAMKIEHREIYIVYGFGGEEVQNTLKDSQISWVEQEEQLGTGHAVLECKKVLNTFDGHILILPGDIPLIKSEQLKN